VTFQSGGETLAAWHLAGEGEGVPDHFTGERGRPCVVMAHGIGGTRDAGLLPFAEAFAEAGLDALLFDYRNFGDSTGEPRQYGRPARHRDDYRSAVDFARRIDGVDPERIVLWGTSWSGGHVVYVAADDKRIAAVIAQSPDLDGARTLLEIAKYAGVTQLAKVTAAGIRDALAGLRGRPPRTMPIVGPPGTVAALSSAEAEPGYTAIAGPTWRNEVIARAALFEAQNRAITRIDELVCPILIQIAEDDSIAPPPQARAAAWRAKGRSEVREYPCNHFAIYVGRWRERSIQDQLHFLRRHLAGERDAEPAAASGTAGGA
jgi:uncharacterized protein